MGSDRLGQRATKTRLDILGQTRTHSDRPEKTQTLTGSERQRAGARRQGGPPAAAPRTLCRPQRHAVLARPLRGEAAVIAPAAADGRPISGQEDDAAAGRGIAGRLVTLAAALRRGQAPASARWSRWRCGRGRVRMAAATAPPPHRSRDPAGRWAVPAAPSSARVDRARAAGASLRGRPSPRAFLTATRLTTNRISSPMQNHHSI